MKKHKLESVFILNKKIFDIVKILPSKKESITYFDSYDKKIYFSDDAVKKALIWFKTRFPTFSTNFEITIVKKIPVGSGLGGESTDIATVLNYFFSIYNIKISNNLLLDIALNVGSDVCFFLKPCKIAYVTEYGNEVIPLRQIGIDYKIEYYKYIKSSTSLIFRIFDSHFQNFNFPRYGVKKIYKILKNHEYNELFNNLTPFIFDCYPDIQKEYKILGKKTSDFLIISGSGSSIVRLKNNLCKLKK